MADYLLVLKELTKGVEVPDSLLAFYFATVEDRVKAFCHIDEIPEELERLVVEMTAAYVGRIHGTGTGAGTGAGSALAGGAVKSIKRGDTAIEYADGATASSAIDKMGALVGFEAFFEDYKRQLYNFRRLRTK